MKNSQELKVEVLVAVVALLASPIIVSIPKAFAEKAAGGSGGRGGDTGYAISGDIGPGGSCFAKDHSNIGDECGGSTGSSEPRSGSGDHSMNGGRGGEATVNLND